MNIKTAILLIIGLILSCAPQERIVPLEATMCTYDLQTRSLGVDGQPTMVIAVTTDDGASAYDAQVVRSMLQDSIGPFWAWHGLPNTDYETVYATNYTVSGTPPNSGYQLTDWIEQNITLPVVDSMAGVHPELQYHGDYWQIVVLMPPRAQGYGWEGFYNGLQIGINTGITESRLYFVLTHEIGHGYYLPHSAAKLYRNCSYGQTQVYGGDDIMGGSNFQRLNARNLDQLGLADIQTANIYPGESFVFWLAPVDEDKKALRLGAAPGEKFFLQHRVANNRMTYTDHVYRRETRVKSGTPIRQLVVNMELETRTTHGGTYYVRASKGDTLVFVRSFNTGTGQFTMALPATELVLTVGYPQFLSKNTSVSAGAVGINITLLAGDCNGDNVITTLDQNPLCDVNNDGVINIVDSRAVSRNMGKVGAIAPGKGYINDRFHEIIIGQEAWMYTQAGIDPATLFPDAIGTPTPNSCWFWVYRRTDCY